MENTYIENASLSSSSREQYAPWIALSLVAGLGNTMLCQLLLLLKSPEAILAASYAELRDTVSKDVAERIQRAMEHADIAKALDWLEQPDNHLITLADLHYPRRLLETDQPPPLLYAKGNLQILKRPAMAIVGSRHATAQGETTAENFAESLCRAGLAVVSGLALGIDGAAHRGALKADGATIAVVGTGLDIVYPAKHKALAHQIAQHGLLLSEYALGTPSINYNFPRRNRIISGLSEGCLVVEANVDSGSLITAKLAIEQGREVFAIPGSIHSPVSKGCHALIKQGAKLVESTDDILSELRHIRLPNASLADSPNGLIPNWTNLPSEASPVLACMGFDPIFAEQIAARSGLTPGEVSTMLTLLELEGLVSHLANGQFQRLA
ncbi:DNA-processing protein DprA [Methylophilus sp. Leaf414]|uniref:DNA-processing protein DprA n=1 Tax=Methylophilus sp. Leaf414 TaxID=1736371 RepID=UPI0007010D78|nr:DNA-processing protein DprA [Methylophilus sp. Leaf414]KQT36783.1 DNA-binding protein [Methylophilus sp. Leaf414]